MKLQLQNVYMEQMDNLHYSSALPNMIKQQLDLQYCYKEVCDFECLKILMKLVFEYIHACHTL